jgi:hypothetical protein
MTVASSSWANSSSWAISASNFKETDPVFSSLSASLATTGSNIFRGTQTITGSILISGSSLVATGSWSIQGGVTASLLGTASWANNVVSASYAFNSTTASYALLALTASYFSGSISNAISSSYALTASYIAGFITASDQAALQIRSTASYAAGASFATASFDSTDFINTPSIITHSVSPEKITVLETGAYLVSYKYDFGGAATVNDVVSQIVVNGSTLISSSYLTQQNSSTDKNSNALTFVTSLNANDSLNLLYKYGTSTGGSLTNLIMTVVRLKTAPAYLGTVNSASYALTASYAMNAGAGGGTFPYTGSAQITGSLGVTGSIFVLSGSIKIVGSGSTLFEITGSTGPLFSVSDSTSTNLLQISSGSSDVFVITAIKNTIVSGALYVTSSIYNTGITNTSYPNIVTVDTASGKFAFISTSSFGGGSGTPGGATTTIQFNDAGAFSGSGNFTFNKTTNTVLLTGSLIATSLTETSAERYKTDINPIGYQLDNINKLNPVSYKWKDQQRGKDPEIGFIAEEIAKVYPEFVKYDENGDTESVNYGRLVSVLVKAIQELKTEIDELKKKL